MAGRPCCLSCLPAAGGARGQGGGGFRTQGRRIRVAAALGKHMVAMEADPRGGDDGGARDDLGGGSRQRAAAQGAWIPVAAVMEAAAGSSFRVRRLEGRRAARIPCRRRKLIKG